MCACVRACVRACVCVCMYVGGGEEQSLSAAVWLYLLAGQSGEACRYEWVNRGSVCQSVSQGGGGDPES